MAYIHGHTHTSAHIHKRQHTCLDKRGKKKGDVRRNSDEGRMHASAPYSKHMKYISTLICASTCHPACVQECTVLKQPATSIDKTQDNTHNTHSQYVDFWSKDNLNGNIYTEAPQTHLKCADYKTNTTWWGKRKGRRTWPDYHVSGCRTKKIFWAPTGPHFLPSMHGVCTQLPMSSP